MTDSERLSALTRINVEAQTRVGEEAARKAGWLKCLKCFQVVWRNVGMQQFCENGDHRGRAGLAPEV